MAGAISQGETREEALSIIREAIELILEVQREKLQGGTAPHEIHPVEI